MTSLYSDIQKTDITSDHFKNPTQNPPRYYQTRLRFTSHLEGSLEALGKILKRLARMDLPGRDQVAAYLRHLTHGNRRPRTLYSRFGTIVLFLGLIRDKGKGLETITRSDVEAFIEREQDRGIKITTIKTRLVSVQAFLRYLVEEGIVSGDIFNRRRIRLQLPERLPRAMDPDDLQKLLFVIHDIRDRALILVLLRTGLRIGELLQTKMADVHLRERKIEIYEGEKNRLGRVVYLSDDAVIALGKWLKKRNPGEEALFYGKNVETLSYSTARVIFLRYLEKAGLMEKGYSLHTLRHTFATELLNAGMRLECLQVLLGHRSIEETRRYARLTDKTREEEYFKAMSKIERRDSHDRCDPELAAIFEAKELFAPCREELSEPH
jgi:integrase/recombinase XerD